MCCFPLRVVKFSDVLFLLQICDVDCAEEGGLPPHVFALMVIFFLQQRRESILPTYLNQEVISFFKVHL